MSTQPADKIHPVAFWFLRHGETDWNAKDLSQGSVDIPLNETGLVQARSASLLLRNRGIHSIPAGLEDLDSGVRSQVMHTDHHPMLSQNRLLIVIIQDRGRSLLCKQARSQQAGSSKTKSGKKALNRDKSNHRIGSIISGNAANPAAFPFRFNPQTGRQDNRQQYFL